jgi:hypothetical protein
MRRLLLLALASAVGLAVLAAPAMAQGGTCEIGADGNLHSQPHP